jgi:predicted outer membrane repeat protein
VPSTLLVTHDLNVHAAADPTATHGTLEWAVANAQNGDTILLTADVERTGITLTQGELILTQQNLTIEAAAGQPPVTISGDNLSRVFELAPGAQVTLSNVIITGGNGLANNPATLAADGNGGGIFVDTGAALTVNASAVTGNQAEVGDGAGGGIFVDTGAALTVNASAVTGNQAEFSGGGIFVDAAAALTVNGGTVVGNDAFFNGIFTQAGDGGGVYNLGTVMISGCTLSGNFDLHNGGGIYNLGSLTVSGSTVSGNSATDDGGGIYNLGSLTVSGSTVSGNSAVNGGGIFNGAETPGAYALISNSSTVSGNTGTYGADVYNLGLSVLYLDDSSTIGVLYGNPAILI